MCVAFAVKCEKRFQNMQNWQRRVIESDPCDIDMRLRPLRARQPSKELLHSRLCNFTLFNPRVVKKESRQMKKYIFNLELLTIGR